MEPEGTLPYSQVSATLPSKLYTLELSYIYANKHAWCISDIA
jgi:hypothetical protein